jgi:hypothetical protein
MKQSDDFCFVLFCSAIMTYLFLLTFAHIFLFCDVLFYDISSITFLIRQFKKVCFIIMFQNSTILLKINSIEKCLL